MAVTFDDLDEVTCWHCGGTKLNTHGNDCEICGGTGCVIADYLDDPDWGDDIDSEEPGR